MQSILKLIAASTVLAAAPAAFGADESDCLRCHSKQELTQLSASEISDAIKDPGIPPHRRYADISDEDLQEIANALAGS